MRPRFRGMRMGLVMAAAFVLPASATVQLPTDVWKPKIYRNEIIAELFAGNYRYALQLARDYAIQELRQQIVSGKGAKILMTRLVADLKKITDDPSKSEADKQDDILALINTSLEPETSAPVGPLNLTMRHSVEYGVTRLEWDSKIREDGCYFGTISNVCDFDSGMNPQNCSISGNGGYARYYRQPHYFVDRIVNGQSKSITTLMGYTQATSTTQPFTKLWPTISGFFEYYYQSRYGRAFPNPVPDGRVFFYDVHGEFRDPGSTLSYRVSSDDTALMYQGCGGRHAYSSIADADADGDGRVDFLPPAAYSKYFAKYYGWLPPLLNSLLDD